MGYLHIDNLYKNQVILMFKECYALEKIHGTSAHLTWKHKENTIKFSAGGENHNNFVATFDIPNLTTKLSEIFPNTDVVIYGEAYGGKQQSMSNTYGKKLKFIGFDVKVGHVWVNVPNAEDICNNVGIEFVDYVKITTDLESINAERDKDSVQAIRNGMGPGKLREGVVLRPIIEMTLNNGDRIISKHKRDEFKETKTPREVNPELFKVLSDAKEVAEEWVTEMRLTHVLDKITTDRCLTMNDTKQIITSMIEDVYREAKGEIIESKEVTRAIGNKTVELFKLRLK